MVELLGSVLWVIVQIIFGVVAIFVGIPLLAYFVMKRGTEGYVDGRKGAADAFQRKGYEKNGSKKTKP